MSKQCTLYSEIYNEVSAISNDPRGVKHHLNNPNLIIDWAGDFIKDIKLTSAYNFATSLFTLTIDVVGEVRMLKLTTRESFNLSLLIVFYKDKAFMYSSINVVTTDALKSLYFILKRLTEAVNVEDFNFYARRLNTFVGLDNEDIRSIKVLDYVNETEKLYSLYSRDNAINKGLQKVTLAYENLVNAREIFEKAGLEELIVSHVIDELITFISDNT